MVRKKAVMFIDGNNWYHNSKAINKDYKSLDFKKLAGMIARHFDLDVREIRYYNSTPDIGLGENNYYKHMVFLAKLKNQGLNVKTRKLKKIKENGKMIRIEKGVDVMIASDMVDRAIVNDGCDCCVLISGDSDFVPIMQLIKDSGKEALTTSVLKGYARELLQGDFRFWILKKSDLNKCMPGS